MTVFSRFTVCFYCLLLGVACATTDSPSSPAPEESAEPPAASPTESTPDQGEADSKKELKNTLKWTTASEVENFGFDIYRSTSEDGDFDRMTREPLPGAGTIDEPQSYVWYDTSIEAGVDYYYYIESISMSGVRERFSPIIKSPAKN